MNNVLRRMGRNIRQAREKAGLRQIDISDRIGLTYRHYQNIEAGKINCTVFTICRLAGLFQVRVEELLDICDS